ncbi:hypothetical protein GIB67_041948 [Kingdonia uniflora]|uniref:MULE transposase domain-containing protein n=1 Tax=Kingdonia uniflora TaxID=39325 RepID=A0A7J7NZL3_9MAGN|nr:hypothetical protein GIB67_041948 [Kingdonia uniflora]
MPTNIPPSNEPMPTNVPLSIEPKPIIGQTETLAEFWFEPQPEPVKDLLDFWFKSVAYTEDPYDFSKEFNIDSETTESWTYFMEMLGSNFYGYDTTFVVISDRNPIIINVVPKVFPFAIHMFCAFHISNNIKTTLESMRIAFRMAAEALTSIDFDKYMNAIWNTDPVGLQYILGIPKETWSNLYIPMSRYGVTYTNHVESWNNVILKVRDLPIHVFIEELRRICSKMYYV